jgi:hypothetical protein
MLAVRSARIRAKVAAGCAAWMTFACVPRGSSRSEATAEAGSGSPEARGSVGSSRASGTTRAPTAANGAGASVSPQSSRQARQDPVLDQPWRDDFERTTLGEDWYTDSPVWTVFGGQLCGRGARNHPVWLKRRLPVNARIDFDAASASPDGDIKAEAWGDGSSGAAGVSYRDATSYIFIFGGWRNHFHVLARLDEHAPDRLQLVVDPTSTDPRTRPVIPGTRYHFRIERIDGRTVRWLIDDVEMMSFPDSKPLVGETHDHFAFNDWEVQVCFDGLVITPLGSSAIRGTG